MSESLARKVASRYLAASIDARIKRQIQNLLKHPDLIVRLIKMGADTEVIYDIQRGVGDLRPSGRHGEKIYGVVALRKVTQRRDLDHLGQPLKCLPKGVSGVPWEIKFAQADRGWGPLLYEVALEWASKNGAGLVADRGVVSRAAESVWKKYLARGDVKHKQLDVTKRNRPDVIQLTPDFLDDDCSQESAISHEGRNWAKSPLSKIYYKSNSSVIDLLEKEGRLIYGYQWARVKIEEL